MTQDELIIKRFCTEYKIEIPKVDYYAWNYSGYVLNSVGRVETLNLYCKNIKKIPEYIAELSELTKLCLAGNDLNSITEINNLTKLEELDLSVNGISDLQAVSGLIHLKELDLRRNNIKEIIPLSYLIELKELDLSLNEISNIQPISKLIHLEKLFLNNCNIKDIAPLKNLKQLKSIVMCNNSITNLQPLSRLNIPFVFENASIAYHELEDGIVVGGNKITNPPIEIVKQGNDAIQRYFDKIEKEGVDYIYEAKLILVGEGSSGKTSLQRRLLDENAKLPESDTRTRGIKVIDFEFKKDKIAHIWDFGGQVVYYPVHRFFITENSVFVLLASTRQNDHNFGYWLPTIYQFGGKSPIIIGQTCHEGNTVRWNDLNIYLGNSNFNIVKTLENPYYQIDLPNNNKGLHTIRECIISQIENLPHYGKGVPKSWLTVRNVLIKEAESTSCITFQSFINLCRKVEPEYFKNIIDIEDCCKFFHDIGVVLWYYGIDELKDWVVLESEWAMNAVYKIIDDENIQNNNGHICPDDFNRLWNSESYESKHHILKKMLETFKIAFQTKHSLGQYIIPARLTSMPPDKKWALEKESLRLEYKFEFMPKGIVNQLSAELSRYIPNNEVWNNAVNLAYEVNDTKAQIIEDIYDRKLTITSKGVDARGINILIMDSIKNIIESYKEVKEEIYVKCTCTKCQQLAVPTTFLYDKLLEWSNRINATVTCNESGEVLSISELLYDVGFGKKEVPQRPKIISIFLASSEELKDDRKEFEIFINRENKELIDKGIFIKLEIWEDFIDRMSKTRLQDEYNKAAINSDIFISLFWTKVGKYTSEEFQESFTHFKKKGKPFIYTYFKNAPINANDIKEQSFKSKYKFLNGLEKLGHYPTNYENIADLKYQFKMQLQKIILDIT